MRTKLVPAAFLCAALALPALSAPAVPNSSATGDWWWRQNHEPSPGVLVFGGLTASEVLDDTWVWNGRNWIQQHPRTSPPARSFAAMAYDKARHEVVLFGGSPGNGEDLADTWVWNGRNWIQKFPKTSPPPRDAFAMAYDGDHHDIVLFGGKGPGAGAMGFNDTWVWNGDDWEQKFPAHSPSPRIFPTMAYDAASQQVILFSGDEFLSHFNSSDTWIWNGIDWLEQSPLDIPDATLARFSAAYDGAEHRVVLLGKSFIAGSYVPVTWLWDGSNWTQQNPPSSPTFPGVLAYDAIHRQVVSFDSNSNTYTWNGITWTTESPAVTPPARDGFALSSGVVPEDCDDWR